MSVVVVSEPIGGFVLDLLRGFGDGPKWNFLLPSPRCQPTELQRGLRFCSFNAPFQNSVAYVIGERGQRLMSSAPRERSYGCQGGTKNSRDPGGANAAAASAAQPPRTVRLSWIAEHDRHWRPPDKRGCDVAGAKTRPLAANFASTSRCISGLASGGEVVANAVGMIIRATFMPSD